METTTSHPMIEAIGLSKFYRDFAAIRDVSFVIPAGQVVAFLGPNGAGKSTTMKILTGYLAPSAGAARIAGLDVVADRIRAAERLGYLPENGPLYPEMTPLSLLRFFGHARGLTGARLNARIDDVIHRCALQSAVERAFASCPKATGSASGWRRCCSTSPTFSSWMSPPPDWTRTRSAKCAAPFGRSPAVRGAPARSCSPPISCKRWMPSPIASSSSIRAG